MLTECINQVADNQRINRVMEKDGVRATISLGKFDLNPSWHTNSLVLVFYIHSFSTEFFSFISPPSSSPFGRVCFPHFMCLVYVCIVRDWIKVQKIESTIGLQTIRSIWHERILSLFLQSSTRNNAGNTIWWWCRTMGNVLSKEQETFCDCRRHVCYWARICEFQF